VNAVCPDLLVIEDFLEPLLRERIIAEMNVAPARSSVVHGSGSTGVVDDMTRRSLRLTPTSETAELITARLLGCMDRAAKHFGVTLSECEESQFLRYKEGDFFVAHQDGNTGMLRLDTERRLVSTVIFLSRETDTPETGPNVYCGGSLVFTNLRGKPQKFHVRADPGTLIAFRSETTHEVTPVTHGVRHSIVSWYR
jgi:SM-20-related protein